jgi:FAD synthase
MLNLVTELSEEDEAYSFNITFHGPGDRTFVLSAENQELMEEWMKAVTCASYDYMKVMVTELQKQVDELTGIVFFRNICILTNID